MEVKGQQKKINFLCECTNVESSVCAVGFALKPLKNAIHRSRAIYYAIHRSRVPPTSSLSCPNPMLPPPPLASKSLSVHAPRLLLPSLALQAWSSVSRCRIIDTDLCERAWNLFFSASYFLCSSSVLRFGQVLGCL